MLTLRGRERERESQGFCGGRISVMFRYYSARFDRFRVTQFAYISLSLPFTVRSTETSKFPAFSSKAAASKSPYFLIGVFNTPSVSHTYLTKLNVSPDISLSNTARAFHTDRDDGDENKKGNGASYPLA